MSDRSDALKEAFEAELRANNDSANVRVRYHGEDDTAPPVPPLSVDETEMDTAWRHFAERYVPSGQEIYRVYLHWPAEDRIEMFDVWLELANPVSIPPYSEWGIKERPVR
ncbi:hypothetical protein SCOTTMCG_203 [Mycobacterium phage ScottMcG]|uniref:Uncharacterized protein n=1 Tax=Mycobacterium phage ScottMcG TaxID=546807 RepID=B5LLF1_9CAUD|nr:hypothetical protein SCOTTMCG_203 [Mycobacterium phage ScottMcG]QAY07990.1 hypothetical protein SEA_EMMAELYSIA_213 [Mycobacterium phage EmmaElysia]QED12097.1 hypothetical protein SEA_YOUNGMONEYMATA_208 [Mycobacterium phage YoungMoneyMata]QNJ58802.1 hypothetical protein SEA_CHAYLAJR_207 [Mycobacterium phage ChaylaJr]QOC58288.1 hypothetical protein SEA_BACKYARDAGAIN_205 [Mycobacterium phage BackyardAgain]ACH62848.1 hypothetical protein SCOTTMCG_203 [Mycobacterium phage ScottMcG]